MNWGTWLLATTSHTRNIARGRPGGAPRRAARPGNARWSLAVVWRHFGSPRPTLPALGAAADRDSAPRAHTLLLGRHSRPPAQAPVPLNVGAASPALRIVRPAPPRPAIGCRWGRAARPRPQPLAGGEAGVPGCRRARRL